MAKLKKVEPDVYPREVLVEEEPRYLRRQKPVEIRRRKFGRKAWKSYLRVSVIVVAAAAGAGALYAAGDFLFTNPAMALASPSQVELHGNHFVSRASVLEIFAPDRGRSVLRIPLGVRRAQIESLPWVQRAIVRRALPNHIQVQITERTPIAFLREGSDLTLVDGEGVILDRPLEANFHFPVVTGINSAMPLDARGRRMQMMSEFMDQIRQVRADAGDSVSEIDLSDATDLQATFAGLQNGGNTLQGAVLVHFGNSDFHDKFQVLLNNIAQWQAAAGRIASVDLRFEREVVVNPENPAPAAPHPANAKTSASAGPKQPVAIHAAPPPSAALPLYLGASSQATTKHKRTDRKVHRAKPRANSKSKPAHAMKKRTHRVSAVPEITPAAGEF